MRVCCRHAELVACGVLPKEHGAKEYRELALLKPGETWSVPLMVAYHCRLYYVPELEG